MSSELSANEVIKIVQELKALERRFGGENGLSSGIVSSAVAASKLIIWGYSSCAVFNPYRSFIAREI